MADSDRIGGCIWLALLLEAEGSQMKLDAVSMIRILEPPSPSCLILASIRDNLFDGGMEAVSLVVRYGAVEGIRVAPQAGR